MAMRLRNIALVVPLLLTAQALAFNNEPTGFRGIEWGTDFSKVAGQFERAPGPGTDNYRRKNEKPAFGAASLQSLTYSFYRGKFAGVVMRGSMKESGRAMMDALRSQYGDGSQPDASAQQYFWSGETGSIVLDCDPVKDLCNLAIFSSAAMRQKSADQKGAM
jgi:hypothetical protein